MAVEQCPAVTANLLPALLVARNPRLHVLLMSRLVIDMPGYRPTEACAAGALMTATAVSAAPINTAIPPRCVLMIHSQAGGPDMLRDYASACRTLGELHRCNLLVSGLLSTRPWWN